MERYEITFKSVSKKGIETIKTTTLVGDAKAVTTEFEADASLMLQHRGIIRTLISVKKISNAKTYDQYEAFGARYGFKPDQYEFD